MIQTAALMLDAYRELNARKLFWVVLVVSVLVVGLVALLGVNERGFTIAWWTIDSDGLNSTNFPPRIFYLTAFMLFAIPLWLTWAATILALLSTASVIPDFISQGAIELTLSKPISRVRLYLTKCAGAMLFAFLQVLVFTTAAFIVIGVRGNSWEFGVFWAVPIVTVFFSYLYSMCALLGLLTRSTLASLLLTLLFWFLLFIVNQADSTLLTFKLNSTTMVEERTQEVQSLENELEIMQSGQGEAPQEGGLAALRHALENPDGDEQVAARIELKEEQLATSKLELEEAEGTETLLSRIHNAVLGVKAVLPKTDETINLLNRYTITDEDLMRIQGDADNEFEQSTQDATAALRERSEFWVLGTSLAFTGFIFGIGAVVFARRDF